VRQTFVIAQRDSDDYARSPGDDRAPPGDGSDKVARAPTAANDVPK